MLLTTSIRSKRRSGQVYVAIKRERLQENKFCRWWISTICDIDAFNIILANPIIVIIMFVILQMRWLDECNPSWNIDIMTKLFFLPPTAHVSILVPLVNHYQINFSMAAYLSTSSKPFMISLWMHRDPWHYFFLSSQVYPHFLLAWLQIIQGPPCLPMSASSSSHFLSLLLLVAP